MYDRAMQALYKLSLAPVAETTADRNSYGFREGRSCADAIQAAFSAQSKPNSATWVLEGDIKGRFDNISHEWMLRNIGMDKVVLQKWLKALPYLPFIDSTNGSVYVLSPFSAISNGKQALLGGVFWVAIRG